MKLTYLLASLVVLSPSFAHPFMGKIDRKRSSSASPCETTARPHRIVAKHREGNGIGYPRGYSSLDGFFSYSYGGAVHPFVDVRAHITNDTKWAYNAGIGLRGIVESMRAIFGANFFYDYREGRHRPFNQVGAGLELLGKRWDVRLNGYAPVGKSKKTYFNGFTKFSGNNALFSKRYEVAMYGFDLGVGVVLARQKHWDLHAKLEGYYFHGDFGKQFGGGLFELATDITRYITLKGQVSYDTHFQWIGQGEASLNIPLGRRIEKRHTALACGSLAELEERISEAVDRFEMIVTINHRKNGAAINPLTGQPLFFVFVDNTSHSLGTFESPFPTLAQAETLSTPADVIYVFPGDGTTTGMNQGITLQNNQSLIGSDFLLPVQTSFGRSSIPAQTTQVPSITNTSGDTVTLASNNNTVAGFNITSLTGNGIIGNGTTKNIAIIQNTVTSALQDFSIFQSEGYLIVDNNVSLGIDGLLLSGSLSADILIANNTFQNDNTVGIGIQMSGNMIALSTVNIIGNNFIGNGAATSSFQGITILSAGGAGSPILLAPFTATIANNRAFNMLQFLNFESNGNPSAMDARVIKNSGDGFGQIAMSFSSNGTGGAGGAAGGPLTLVVNGNTMTNANAQGISSNAISVASHTIGGRGGNIASLQLANNTATAQGQTGFNLTNLNSSFTIESPAFNASPAQALQAVEAMNNGSFTTSGTFTFVPFE